MIILKSKCFSDEVYDQREYASIRMAKKIAGRLAKSLVKGKPDGKAISTATRNHLGRNQGKLLNNPALQDKVNNAVMNTTIKSVYEAQGLKPTPSAINQIKSAVDSSSALNQIQSTVKYGLENKKAAEVVNASIAKHEAKAAKLRAKKQLAKNLKTAGLVGLVAGAGVGASVTAKKVYDKKNNAE